MQDDFNEIYGKFSEKKNNSITKTIIITVICSILCTLITVGIIFNIPTVKEKNLKDEVQKIDKENKNIETTSTQQISLKEYSDTAIYAANKVLPSIVGINVEYTVTTNSFFNLTQSGTASGSGIIISEDGYILTNNHIVNSSDSSYYYQVSEATAVTVYLYNNNTPYKAEIIGTDEETDLAIIKIDKEGLVPVELGDSDNASVGEFVLAIGNPLGLQSSVTSGIVSAVNREVTTTDGVQYSLIQTDAAINSGNSGGALVNSEGKVIGINTLKLSGTGIEGVGFAIPINKTIDIYTQLIENGKVLRPYIGIEGTNLDEKTASKYSLPVGVYINSVQSFSPAEIAGLKVGDVIVKADGESIKTIDELNAMKNKKNIGEEMILTICRNNENIEITITLQEKP